MKIIAKKSIIKYKNKIILLVDSKHLNFLYRKVSMNKSSKAPE